MILVFLTGQEEIEIVCRKLRGRFGRFTGDRKSSSDHKDAMVKEMI